MINRDVSCLLTHGVLNAEGVPGKPEWRGMLDCVAALRRRSVFPAEPPLPFDWLDIGPGYCYGPAFGHIDLAHQVLDFAATDPDLARRQMLNQLAIQREDGSIAFPWMGENPARFFVKSGMPMAERLRGTDTFPPLWVVAIEACLTVRPDEELLTKAYRGLARMLQWFDAERKASDGGYFYADVLGPDRGDSGMDHSIRFLKCPSIPAGCVDACSHVYWCLAFAAAWAKRLGEDHGCYEQARAELGRYIQQHLFCEETAWFHDSWTVADPSQRHLSFEGMWPMVVGAATPDQADAALRKNLLNPERFNTPHPIATVARCDPAFELRMWRGPAWNCMTLWAAEACLRYGRPDGARELLEKALDCTAAQFARTGTVWEFYHPEGGNPDDLVRKPGRAIKGPCRDYLGHNPLHAMAGVWSYVKQFRSDRETQAWRST